MVDRSEDDDDAQAPKVSLDFSSGGFRGTIKNGKVSVVAPGNANVDVRTNGNITRGRELLFKSTGKSKGCGPENANIGDVVEGKGIYIGEWEPIGSDGISLGRIFNLYAAPEDIFDNGKRLNTSFNNMASRVVELKDWNGHDGFNHLTNSSGPDQALYDALSTDQYEGEWFVPTSDILHGINSSGNQTLSNHLHSVRDIGALKGTFENNFWYWASTQQANGSGNVFSIQCTGSKGAKWRGREDSDICARLVRAELQ